jgi:predicted metal-binding protein
MDHQSDDSPSPINNEKENIAKNIVTDEIKNVQSNPMLIKQNECYACHILFKLADKMQTSESDASDLLSEILSHDAELNDLFIEMVENIHMKQRMMAVAFSIKNRQAKDKYIDSNFRNTLS